MVRLSAIDRFPLITLRDPDSVTILALDGAPWDEENEMLHWVKDEWEEDPDVLDAIEWWTKLAETNPDEFYDELFARNLVSGYEGI